MKKTVVHHPDNQPEDLMTVAEVANHYGVNSATVSRWARTGQLPVAVTTLGGHKRFRRSDVIALARPGDQASRLTP